MRLWRNRQTRTFEGRMGNHPGSSPGNRTNYSEIGPCKGSVFLLFGIVGAVTGRVHRMTPQGGDIRCTRLGERLFGYDMLVSPTIAERQVPVYKRGESLSFFVCAVIERGLPRS